MWLLSDMRLAQALMSVPSAQRGRVQSVGGEGLAPLEGPREVDVEVEGYGQRWCGGRELGP